MLNILKMKTLFQLS